MSTEQTISKINRILNSDHKQKNAQNFQTKKIIIHFLYNHNNLTQKEIASKLNLSQCEVSRCLKIAKEQLQDLIQIVTIKL